MKTLYLVTTKIMNGTVCMNTLVSAFTSKELAEKTKQAADIANNREKPRVETMGQVFEFKTYTEVSEITLYEKEKEVPILQEIHL